MVEKKTKRRKATKVENLFVVSVLEDVETGGHKGHPTAFFEVHPAHPGGQALVAGPMPVKVGRTAALAAAIREEKVREVDPEEAEDLHDEYHSKRLARRRKAAAEAVDEEMLASLPAPVRALVEERQELRGAKVPEFDKDLSPTSSPAPTPSTVVQDKDDGADTDIEDEDEDDLEDEDDEVETLKPVNPKSMSHPDLLAEAARRGVTSVNADMTKAEIADEINANLKTEE